MHFAIHTYIPVTDTPVHVLFCGDQERARDWDPSAFYFRAVEFGFRALKCPAVVCSTRDVRTLVSGWVDGRYCYRCHLYVAVGQQSLVRAEVKQRVSLFPKKLSGYIHIIHSRTFTLNMRRTHTPSPTTWRRRWLVLLNSALFIYLSPMDRETVCYLGTAYSSGVSSTTSSEKHYFQRECYSLYSIPPPLFRMQKKIPGQASIPWFHQLRGWPCVAWELKLLLGAAVGRVCATRLCTVSKSYTIRLCCIKPANLDS